MQQHIGLATCLIADYVATPENIERAIAEAIEGFEHD